jgi:hypothetical protein
MYRLDRDLAADELEDWAVAFGARPRWGRARCEHGLTSEQNCYDCEGGYVQDTHRFIEAKGDVVIGAVSDDHEFACYVVRSGQTLRALRKLLRIPGWKANDLEPEDLYRAAPAAIESWSVQKRK